MLQRLSEIQGFQSYCRLPDIKRKAEKNFQETTTQKSFQHSIYKRLRPRPLYGNSHLLAFFLSFFGWSSLPRFSSFLLNAFSGRNWYLCTTYWKKNFDLKISFSLPNNMLCTKDSRPCVSAHKANEKCFNIFSRGRLDVFHWHSWMV